ncbi:DNRLRE domain-containing protein [Streptomyces sp. NPDC088725]|uniref:DNRLRE domain-containing protein n=1 Tax=Streptomyces sp. NPDC088725 TaxID=3365873 RepID=UPI00380BC363
MSFRGGGAAASVTRPSSSRWLRRISGVVLLALAVETATVAGNSGQVVAVGLKPSAVSAVEPAKGPAEAADVASARLAARLQDRRIEALSERTEDSTTYVNPDGSLTTEAFAGPVRVRQDDGSWRVVDTTLSDLGEGLKPATTVADLSFSDGGDRHLAAVRHEGRTFGMDWPAQLPAPKVKDSTASYPLGGGTTLNVTALAQGFEQTIVLDKAPATAPSYRIPMRLEGLELSKDSDSGHLLLKDPKGKLVAEAPAPRLWDSSLNPASGEPAHQGPVATRIEKSDDGATTLVLTPDPAFFDQDLTYPVTVDPTSTLAVTTDTWVQKPDYPDSQVSSDELKSGTYDSGSHVARSYLKFDVAKFKDAHIASATMSLYSYYSATCTTTGPPTEVRRITGTWDSHQITWGAQPATTATNLASNTGHWGYNSSCPANWSNWTLTKMVQDWADGATNYGVQLRSADETDLTTWRRFRSANYKDTSYAPKLVVNYNSRPGTPTLVAPASGTSTSNTKPVLQAKATDADGDKVRLTFEIWNAAGTTRITSGTSAAASSGAAVSWNPTAALAQGGYKWRVQASDGADNSTNWSVWNTLTVDTTAPGTTTVSSTAFPAATWSGTPDENGNFSGSFTFTPPATDVADVQYKLDSGAWSTAATTGKPVTKTLTFRSGTRTVTTHTRDAAGNTSPDTTYVFYAGSGAALNTPQQGDRPARRATLSAEGKSTYTGVRYQYRRGENDTWTDIPVKNVHRAADGATITGWPMTAPSGKPDALTWNVTDTLSQDGPVDVRAVFNGTITTDPSEPNTVTVDRNAGTAPSQPAGPGSVNLLTGDLTLSDTDASAFDMSVARTYSSRRPNAGAEQEGQAPVFGPQWTSGTVAELTESDWAYVKKSSTSSVALVDVDGEETGFTATAKDGWKPEPGSEDLTLTAKGKDGKATTKIADVTGFTLTDTEGTQTTFSRPDTALPTWTVSSTYLPTDNSTTKIVSQKVDGKNLVRPRYVIAPTSAVTAATCESAPSTRGCRVVEFVYATTTTATSSAFGNIAGQVQQLRLWSTEPGASASTAISLEQYLYDDAGRLRHAWDPRINPNLKTVYTYDSAGRVATQAAPGELPWTFTYGKAGKADTAGDGMLLKASRPTLRQGSQDATDGGTAATSFVYDVPLTGAKAPYPMGQKDVAAWGQNAQVPTDATAVFPADAVPASHDGSGLTPTKDPKTNPYHRATLTYIDASGRQVNTASPGGGITTTQFDRFGNTVQELTAANHQLALATGGNDLDRLAELGLDNATSAERAEKLSTTTVYEPKNGLRKLEESGPLHLVTLQSGLPAAGDLPALPAGTRIAARAHTVTAYDEGRPANAAVSDQPTTVTTGAAVEDYPSDADTRTSTTAYDWAKGLPVKTVDDPNGLKITKTTAYDTQGRVTQSTLPKSNGTDAGTTKTLYWSATGTGACQGRPEWADLLCSTGPAGAITGGGSNPTQLPTSTTEYDRWGSTAKVTDSANGVTRTTTSTYDAAGRPTTTAVTGGVGTAVANTSTTYDKTTGKTATVTNGTGTITHTYDVLGREISYADGSGNTTTTAFDLLDRPVTVTDSAPSSTTYTYNAQSAPQGQATALADSVAGTFTPAYDIEGNPTTEKLPGGITLALTRDTTGTVTDRTYTRDTDREVITSDATEESIHGQVVNDTTLAGGTREQTYTYDATGRLTRADDTTADGTCTRRGYTFDNNTNRTALANSSTDTSDPCTSTGAVTTSSTYDSADRLIATGVVYDAFGRTTSQPGTTIGYYTNDLVRTQTAGEQRQTWLLDPGGRLGAWTTEQRDGDGSWNLQDRKSNHYGSDSDSPDWILENSTTRTVTRNIQDLTGDLAATTTDTGGTVLQLTNIHGDVAVQYPLDTAKNPTVLQSDEYGNPLTDTTRTRYGWLGAKQRSTETLTGLTLMGVRLYNPTTGRFLSIDPVPGGGDNAYGYPGDPVNQYDLDGKSWWKKARRNVRRNWRTYAGYGATAACIIASAGTCAVASVAVFAATSYADVRRHGWRKSRGSIARNAAWTAFGVGAGRFAAGSWWKSSRGYSRGGRHAAGRSPHAKRTSYRRTAHGYAANVYTGTITCGMSWKMRYC